MSHLRRQPLVALVASTLLFTGPALHAQTKPPPRPAAKPSAQAQLDALRKEVEAQQEQLEGMRKSLAEQDARYRELLQTLEAQQKERDAALARAQPPATSATAAPAQRSAGVQPGADESPRVVQIGTAPPVTDSPLNVPQLFSEPSVLTPRGMTIVEPSFQYGYSSNNRAALIGYTVVPAILIGLVDVREVRRNTAVAALTLRHGFSDRFELEARLPYVYRSDSTVSREIFTGTATDASFGASGHGIGDVELTGRYQLTRGESRWPYLIGSLRLKSRTGKDPFQVTTDCVTRCTGGATGTGEPLELPTGTGFYSVQPGLTWLYPSDPAVFFGSFTYAYNLERHGVSRHVLGGDSEFIGDVKAGNVLGFNFGMGLAVNDRSSFSIGVDVNTIGRTRQNGQDVPGSVRTTLASLLLGYSFRWDQNRTVNLSVGAGLTRDTPDLTITARVPFSF